MSPAEARAEARRILSERRFRGTSLPRPFHRALEWLARHLRFIARAWDWLSVQVGGADVLWAIVGALVLAIAIFFAMRLAQRRTELEALSGEGRVPRRNEDPAALERLADDAERRGELEAALRLRFRAGLLRLGRAKVLPVRPSLRTREVRRTLRSARFDRLARDFDEVVYGRRSPVGADVEAARTEWPLVLAEARR